MHRDPTSEQRRIRCTWMREIEGWTPWQQARAASSSSSSRRPRRRPSPATSAGTSTSRRRVGHIRDLPNPSELPADMKKGPFGKFAVDVDNGFEPYYVVDADKKKKVAELKRLLKDADELYLATDEDREGEAIAWHLLEVLKPKVPVKRMVFHEITREAIQRAVDDTRDLDTAPGRRPGDPPHPRPALRLRGSARCCGARSGQGLSAGRVQSVATRLVVERERERMAFRAAVLLGRRGRLHAAPARGRADAFTARLPCVDGDRVATGRDFADDGELTAQGASSTSTRRSRRGIATAVQDVAGRRHRRPGEALHAPPGGAVHDLDPAAGGVAQAAAVARRTRCASRSGSTRTATSPTCVPTRIDAVGRARSTAARSQARDLYGAEYVPDEPAPLREEGQERAGGPRGDPPGRRPLPHARPRWPVSCAATSSRSTS